MVYSEVSTAETVVHQKLNNIEYYPRFIFKCIPTLTTYSTGRAERMCSVDTFNHNKKKFSIFKCSVVIKVWYQQNKKKITSFHK